MTGWKWDKQKLQRVLGEVAEEIEQVAQTNGGNLPKSGKVVWDSDDTTAVWGTGPDGEPVLTIRVTGYMK